MILGKYPYVCVQPRILSRTSYEFPQLSNIKGSYEMTQLRAACHVEYTNYHSVVYLK